MSIPEARKLMIGSRVRLKATGEVFEVTSKEPSGRVIYGKVNGNFPVVARRNTEIRAEVRKGHTS